MKRAGVFAAALVMLACQSAKQSDRSAPRAQFGVFFGGQVQEREQIPFEISRARQVQGFRIDFEKPLADELPITWEINRPAKSRAKKRGASDERQVLHGEARARVGQTRFDQVLAFEPGDPLGTWNIRVVVGQDLVIDRRFLVYDAEQRARALAADAGATR
jgi:hypothetical protein